MKKSVYNNKPISEQDLTDYICTEYKAVKGVWTITDVKDTVGITEPLLQIELGDEDDNDCTLVAFTSVIRQFIADSTIAAKDIYSTVFRIASKYGYKKSWGTNPIFMKRILDESLAEYGIKRSTRFGLMKNVGVSIKTIQRLIGSELFALSLWSDNRGYYKDHTITICGLREFKVKNKKYYFLKVMDGWNKELMYLDFQKLSCICSVNYI